MAKPFAMGGTGCTGL